MEGVFEKTGRKKNCNIKSRTAENTDAGVEKSLDFKCNIFQILFRIYITSTKVRRYSRLNYEFSQRVNLYFVQTTESYRYDEMVYLTETQIFNQCRMDFAPIKHFIKKQQIQKKMRPDHTRS